MAKKVNRKMLIPANPRSSMSPRASNFDVKMELLKAVYVNNPKVVDDAVKIVREKLELSHRDYLLGRLLILREEIRGG